MDKGSETTEAHQARKSILTKWRTISKLLITNYNYY